MKLILMRHGSALDRDEAIARKIEDAKRPLVEKGKQRTYKVCTELKKRGFDIDMVVSSPLLRARQTAEIVCDVFHKKEIHQSSELVPEAPPQSFALWLSSYAGTNRSLLAVGHEPHLSTFVSWVLAGTTTTFVEFKKSGLICVNVESLTEVGPKSGLLEWAIQPKLLVE